MLAPDTIQLTDSSQRFVFEHQELVKAAEEAQARAADHLESW